MIAGALATLLASGAYFAADSIKTNANIYRNANRMDDEGVFWPTNPEVERMLQHDIRSLWETGKRDFIPEGLEGFFEENNSARRAYFDALAAQCMLETAASPWRHGARSIGTLIIVFAVQQVVWCGCKRVAAHTQTGNHFGAD